MTGEDAQLIRAAVKHMGNATGKFNSAQFSPPHRGNDLSSFSHSCLSHRALTSSTLRMIQEAKEDFSPVLKNLNFPCWPRFERLIGRTFLFLTRRLRASQTLLPARSKKKKYHQHQLKAPWKKIVDPSSPTRTSFAKRHAAWVSF